MPKQTSNKTHFVVERLNWRRWGEAFCQLPGQTRLASFDTAEEAEAFCRHHEESARRRVNPFAGALSVPHNLTDMPESVLCDFLQDQGIDPPAQSKAGRRDWAKWWRANAPSWDDVQRAAVWRALDKVRFHRVVEQPRRPVAYALVKVVWQYNDEWFFPGGEGGQATKAYRSRERAEQECSKLNERERRTWTRHFERDGWGYEPAGLNQFDLEGRLLPGRAPFDPEPSPTERLDEDGEELWTFAPDEVPFYEVVEVELEGAA
jgi:hypothetical protein